MIEVSFIIPSYNSYKTIDHTLRSIFQQKYFDCVKEIIVVDSSDDRETRKLLKDSSASSQDGKESKLRVILLDKKTSPAIGRNIGAAASSGDLFCFIDSDVYLAEDWLKEIINAYDKGCMVGCGSVSLPDFQKNSSIAKAQLYLQFNEYLYAGEAYSRPIVPSCNLFCSKEAFKTVGGFPDLRASEDTMFCLQLERIEKVWFIPSAKCFHIFREEWAGFIKNQELLGKYISIYRRMHYKSGMYKGIMPVILFPGFLAIKKIRIVMRVIKAGPYHWKQFISSYWFYGLGLIYWSIGFIKGCFSKDETIRR